MRSSPYFKVHIKVIRCPIWIYMSFERKFFGPYFARNVGNVAENVSQRTLLLADSMKCFRSQFLILLCTLYVWCVYRFFFSETYVIWRKSKDIPLAMSILATLVDVLKNYVVRKAVMLALGENSTVLLLNGLSRKIIRIMGIFFSQLYRASWYYHVFYFSNWMHN